VSVEGSSRARADGLVSPLRRRSPVLAALVAVACGWLLWDWWPDLGYFLSPTAPIDLGDVRAFHLDRAQANRLVRIAGPLVGTVGGIESGGGRRRVSGLFGTNLVLDRAAGPSPTTVYEGRLLPSAERDRYAPFVAELRRQGWTPGERWMVLREGERPRTRWGRLALSLLLVGVISFNVAFVVRRLVR